MTNQNISQSLYPIQLINHIMHINADLHIHSKYSMATSPKMDLTTLASESRKKGIQLVATGDCLHPKWLSEIMKIRRRTVFFQLITSTSSSHRGRGCKSGSPSYHHPFGIKSRGTIRVHEASLKQYRL